MPAPPKPPTGERLYDDGSRPLFVYDDTGAFLFLLLLAVLAAACLLA